MIGERDGKFQPLEIAIGELTARTFCVTVHTDEFQQTTGLLSCEPWRRGPKVEELPAIRHQRHLNVLAHRHGRECRGDLEGTSNAQPPDRAWFLAGGVLAEQIDPARAGNRLPVEHIEARALAGAVGADQRQDFPAFQRERYAAHGTDAAIGFAQAFD